MSCDWSAPEYSPLIGAGLTVVTLGTTLGAASSLGLPVFQLDQYPAWAPPLNTSLATPTQDPAAACGEM